MRLYRERRFSHFFSLFFSTFALHVVGNIISSYCFLGNIKFFYKEHIDNDDEEKRIATTIVVCFVAMSEEKKKEEKFHSKNVTVSA